MFLLKRDKIILKRLHVHRPNNFIQQLLPEKNVCNFFITYLWKQVLSDLLT